MIKFTTQACLGGETCLSDMNMHMAVDNNFKANCWLILFHFEMLLVRSCWITGNAKVVTLTG